MLNAQTLGGSCELSVDTEGKNYEKLILNVTCDQIGKVAIPGVKSTNGSWLFSIPDSVYEKHYKMVLNVITADSIIHRLNFDMGEGNASISDFSIGPNKTIIKALYLSTLKMAKMPAFQNKDVIMDNFKIIDPDINMRAYLDLMREGYGMRGENRTEAFSSFLSMTDKYGETHNSVSQLYSKLNLFKTREEITQFFNVLSLVQKNSYFGRKIKSFLDLTFFPQIQLPMTVHGRSQNIISDSCRYVLVVFSASWCSPCHKQIPLLLAAYNDLKEYGLDIVYISMDDSSTVKSWEPLMKKYKIPWNSFLAKDKLDEVKSTYAVIAIPTTYLVHFGGKFEKLNIMNQRDFDHLYKVVKHNN